jgi:hypothetical protein
MIHQTAHRPFTVVAQALGLGILVLGEIGACSAHHEEDESSRDSFPLGSVTQASMVSDCVGYCGGQAPAGCYCDDLCTKYGDCCADYEQVCGGTASCAGYCGGQAPTGCYCDDLCTKYGDCCADYIPECFEGGSAGAASDD